MIKVEIFEKDHNQNRYLLSNLKSFSELAINFTTKIVWILNTYKK